MDYPIPQTREEFDALVRAVMEEQSLSLVMAAYQVMDQLTEQELAQNGPELACCQGCNFCCYQMVTTTRIEWEEIEQFMEERRLFRAWRKKITQVVKKWIDYSKRTSRQRQANPVGLAEDWAERRACVFLKNDGSCGIYPVRPIVCRTLTSTVTCTDLVNQEGLEKWRFPWMQWGDQLVLDEQERLDGKATTTPILYWLYVMARRKGRFGG